MFGWFSDSPRRVAAIAVMALTQACTAASNPVPLPQPATDSVEKGAQTAVFAGGCFWGVEAVFRHTRGVIKAVSGYAGGAAKTAEYELVGLGTTLLFSLLPLISLRNISPLLALRSSYEKSRDHRDPARWAPDVQADASRSRRPTRTR